MIEKKVINNEVGKWYERPWGRYKTLDLSDGYQVKIIEVNPGGRLSLQKHFRRLEHWVVIAGTPQITVGDKVQTYNISDYIFIARETPHRLENLTMDLVRIAEIQIGDYLGEDDIVRLNDVYGRG